MEGTTGKANTPTSTTGQTLDYKNVQFPPKEDPKPTPKPKVITKVTINVAAVTPKVIAKAIKKAGGTAATLKTQMYFLTVRLQRPLRVVETMPS